MGDSIDLPLPEPPRRVAPIKKKSVFSLFKKSKEQKPKEEDLEVHKQSLKKNEIRVLEQKAKADQQTALLKEKHEELSKLQKTLDKQKRDLDRREAKLENQEKRKVKQLRQVDSDIQKREALFKDLDAQLKAKKQILRDMKNVKDEKLLQTLKIIDDLLGGLAKAKIKKFAQSNAFPIYKETMKRYGVK